MKWWRINNSQHCNEEAVREGGVNRVLEDGERSAVGVGCINLNSDKLNISRDEEFANSAKFP